MSRKYLRTYEARTESRKRVIENAPPTYFSFEKFLENVQEELDNPKFAGCTHYLRSTYTSGCRGPLCMTSSSDWYLENKFKKGKISYKELTEEYPDFENKYNLKTYTFIAGYLLANNRALPDQLQHALGRYGIRVYAGITTDLGASAEMRFAVAREIAQSLDNPDKYPNWELAMRMACW